MSKGRRVLKWVGIVLAVLVLALAATVFALASKWPPDYSDTPRPELQASTDPEVIAAGAHLFHGAAHCAFCHADFEAQRAAERGGYAGIVPTGGRPIPFGPLGTLHPSNLSSDPDTGIGAMSDADLARVIRYGVRPDGSPAPFMVVASRLTDQDLVAIISYLRSLPPTRAEIPPSEISLLGRVLFSTVMKIMFQPSSHGWESPPNVPEGDEPSIERGEYLARGPANCIACHSQFPADMSSWTPNHPFGGGAPAMQDEADPSKEFGPPNLTPHPEHGWLRTWSEDAFVQRFASGERRYEGSVMPWENFRHMSDNDLRSIYRYLQSLPPVDFDPGPVHRDKGWQPEG